MLAGKLRRMPDSLDELKSIVGEKFGIDMQKM